MNLNYYVPRESYIYLLSEMIRKNDRRPIRIFTAFLATIGQFGIVLALCIFKLDRSQWPFFLIWSILLAGLTILRRSTVSLRAKGTLQRLEYTGQLSPDYWEKHRLRVHDSALFLNYGQLESTCALSSVSRIDEIHGTLYVYCENAVFDIIPQTAFDSSEAMHTFAQQLLQLAHEQHSEQAVCSSKNDTSEFDWEMDPKDFLNGQYFAYRTLYYRYRFLRKATFLRLAVSVFAVVNLIANHSAVNTIICVLLLLLANLENISMIPAICKKRIRTETGNWKGSQKFGLSIGEHALSFSSEQEQVSIPFDRINLCEEIQPYFVISWNQFPAVIIPKEKLNDERAAHIIRQVKSRMKPEAQSSGS